MITATGIAVRAVPQRHSITHPVFVTSLLIALAIPSQSAFSQSTAPAAAPTSAQNAPEITQHEETTTFKVKVNLVEVRVVVRDAKGHVVDNLKQDDFQLFDNGKPQIISKFSIERATDKPTVHSETAATAPDETAAPTVVQPVMAKRFVAYLFDDMHLRFADLSQTRNAAVKHLQSLSPEDRAGVFTTSGQGQQDFTADRAQLIAAMNRIAPRSRESQQYDCPYITYYQADLIINQQDAFMQQRAVDDAMKCTLLGGGGGSKLNDPANGPAQKLAMIVNSASRRELEIGDNQVRLVLSTIQGLVRRMAELPGQRTIVLVSPGFFMTGNGDLQWRESEVMEQAVHAITVINTLDARGLYTPTPDASETRQPNVSNAGRILQYQIAEQDINQNVLAELADATGGTFFRNDNDFEEGFRRLAAPPEVSYLLAFSPQNLKLDGKYHNLKVTLKSPADGSVQARKGYYAPTQPSMLLRKPGGRSRTPSSRRRKYTRSRWTCKRNSSRQRMTMRSSRW